MRFNPRLREGGDGLRSAPLTGLSCFNPRLREGGDIIQPGPIRCHTQFQSTPPRGRRLILALFFIARHWFQSTPPRGRRHRHTPLYPQTVCLNPRLREGGDALLPDHKRAREAVSIHASAREATLRRLPGSLRQLPVSIHASAREATGERHFHCAKLSSFNPRLREGGDSIDY